MFARKLLKGRDSPIYINDQLTQINSKIFQQARQLQKQKVITSTWTRLSKICVKKTELSAPTWIQSLDELPL